MTYTSGSITYSSTEVNFSEGTVGLRGTIANIVPYNIDLVIPSSGQTATFNDGNLNLKATETLTANLGFPESIQSFLPLLKSFLPSLLKIPAEAVDKIYDVVSELVTNGATVQLSGEMTLNKENKTLSFTENSTVDLALLGYNVNLTVIDGGLSGLGVYYENNDNGISAGAKITASPGDGKLKVVFSKGGTNLFYDVLEQVFINA